MNTYSIYDLQTGLFTGVTVSCRPQHLSANVPDGCGCLLGEYDALSQRVNTETGDVVDYVPPRPSDRHEWNDAIKRWVYVPTPAEVCRTQRAAAYPPLAELADALYWQAQGDDSKMTAYLEACAAVKARFPKPQE